MGIKQYVMKTAQNNLGQSWSLMLVFALASVGVVLLLAYF
jgi:hypothetical protein